MVANTTPTSTESQIEDRRMTRFCPSMPAPCACETRTPTEASTPMPKTKATLKRPFAKAAAASELVPTCPTISVSTRPINIWPTCPAMIGQASAKVLVNSAVNCRVLDIDRSTKLTFVVDFVVTPAARLSSPKSSPYRTVGPKDDEAYFKMPPQTRAHPRWRFRNSTTPSDALKSLPREPQKRLAGVPLGGFAHQACLSSRPSAGRA